MQESTRPDNLRTVRMEETLNDRTDSDYINQGPKWYQRKRVLIPFSLFLIAAIAVAIYWYGNIRGFVSTDDAFIDGNKITVSAKILGRISKLGANEGDTVSQGQLLASLEQTDLRSQEAQAQANLDYSKENVNLAQVNLRKAQEDFARADYQFKESIITKEQYDHARIAVDAAQAQLSVARAQVNNSAAQLNVVQTQIGNTDIISSSRGVIARRWVITGDVVQPGQPIYTMYDLDSVWVSAIFEETKIAQIHPGDQVEIKVDAYKNDRIEGRVSMIGAAAASQFSLIPPNNASGNFTKVTQRVPIKIAIDRNSKKSSYPLLPGMSVEVRIREK